MSKPDRIPKYIYVDDKPKQVVWDTSSLSTFLACPRLYNLTNLRGYKLKSYGTVTGFGSAVHDAYEILDRGRFHNKNKQDTLREAIEFTLKNYGADLSLSEDKARGLEAALRAIVWRVDEYWDDNIKIASMPNGEPCLEKRFEVPFGDTGKRFSGRIDKIVEFEGGLYLCDTKTTKASLSDMYFRNYQPNNQVYAYLWAARHILNLPVRGFIIDAVQTGVHFCRFNRAVFNVSNLSIDEWYADTVHSLGISEAYWDSQYYPANFTSCGNYGGCRYREACAHAKSQRHIFFGNDFKQEYHPDLEETKPMKLEVIQGGKQ